MALSNSSNSFSVPDSFAWKQAYEAVLAETEKQSQFHLLEVAEAEILTGREALKAIPAHHAEWQALEEALASLQVVKRERLNFGATE